MQLNQLFNIIKKVKEDMGTVKGNKAYRQRHGISSINITKQVNEMLQLAVMAKEGPSKNALANKILLQELKRLRQVHAKRYIGLSLDKKD